MGGCGAELEQLTFDQKITGLVPALPAHVSKCLGQHTEPRIAPGG